MESNSEAQISKKKLGAVRRQKNKRARKRNQLAECRNQMMEKVRMPSNEAEVDSAKDLSLEQKLLVQRNLQKMHGQEKLNNLQKKLPKSKTKPKRQMSVKEKLKMSTKNLKALLEEKLAAKRKK